MAAERTKGSSPAGPRTRSNEERPPEAPGGPFRGTLDRGLGERIEIPAYDPHEKPTKHDIVKHQE